MFDANMSHLPKGKKFFSKYHYCTDESPLYKIGVRSGVYITA